MRYSIGRSCFALNRRPNFLYFEMLLKTLLVTSLLSLFAFSEIKAEPLSIDQLWQSETFLKSYTTSYGVDSRIEPLINEEESEFLTELTERLSGDDKEEALEEMKASELVETSPAILFAMGNLHFEKEKPEVAIEYFEKAIALFPNFRDAHRNVAMLKLQKPDYKGAETHLRKAIELGSQEGLTYGLLAYCHSQNGRHQAALSAYRMAQVTMPEEMQWRLGEAYTLQTLGEANQASSIYAELLKRSPYNLSLWINQANACLQSGKKSQAIAHLEMAKRISQLNPTNHAILGQLYLGESLPDKALQNFQAAIKDKSAAFSLAVNCLGHLTNHQQWSQAKQLGTEIDQHFSEEISKKASRDLISKYSRSMAMVELETGNAKAGAKRIETLLETHPNDGDALLLLARFREDNNEPEKAMVLLEQAAGIPEKRAAALLAHGKILADLFRYDEALVLLEEAKTLKPTASLTNYIEAIRDLN